MQNIHASSIVYKEKGILFVGKSGVGKSDICLRLISRGGKLIADDRTNLNATNGKLYASCPEQILGLLEVRGVGIQKVEFVKEHSIDLVVELVESLSDMERIPEETFQNFGGLDIKKVRLFAFEASVLDKLDIILTL